MISILGGLDTTQQALTAQQYALSITQRNIANVNNPSYTRQDVLFTGDYSGTPSSGIAGASLQASRNRYLDYSISNEQSTLGQSNVEQEAMKQVDSVMNGLGNDGLQESLSNYFNSFSSLSSNPTDLSLRRQVLTSANALCGKFQQIYSGLQQLQASQDQEATNTVHEVNSITAKIVDLNNKVSTAKAAHSENEFTLRDDRQQLLEDLSNIIGTSYLETESGSVTVATKNGDPLVLGNKNVNLEFGPSTGSAFQGITLAGKDITATLQSGSLGGLLKMRDETIPAYMSALDDLAAGIISRVNTVHGEGVDLDNNNGGDFFSPFVPAILGSNEGAASSISVALTDPQSIAAADTSSDAGNNENAKLLASIGTEKLFSDNKEAAGEFYAGLIYRVGADEKDAEDRVVTQNSLLDQLKNQRESASGVDLNEEAINIMKFQKAYQANARYVSVLDTLSQDILRIMGG
jgi:flagellar hook-associated protein 1